ncbi:DNA polymerase III subunit tau, isoform gamma [Serratia symbiotica]|nr:DNA polymerase III subunit tau, isoform gamma [Serratia symbiotica]
MYYQVLARKWRPKIFTDVVGQEHIITALSNSLLLGRIHHAYLFSGTRGVGKTTIARLLAKGLNCIKGITDKPCIKCNNCCEIEKGCFIDLIEIDAASRTKVEDTRDLLDNIPYAPVNGRFKVYLIDEVHMLSRYSFNALLKTLEEPPSHVKFILATTDPQKIPITVLSRCLQFHLKVLDVKQIFNHLKTVLKFEKIIYDNSALKLLSQSANGSMRDALSLTDQAIVIGYGNITTNIVKKMLSIIDDEYPLLIIEELITFNGEKVMQYIEECSSYGIDWDNLLIELLTILHYISMIQLLSINIDNKYLKFKERLNKISHILLPEDIQLYYQILLIGRKELIYAPNFRMGVEMTLLRILAFYPK